MWAEKMKSSFCCLENETHTQKHEKQKTNRTTNANTTKRDFA